MSIINFRGYRGLYLLLGFQSRHIKYFPGQGYLFIQFSAAELGFTYSIVIQTGQFSWLLHFIFRYWRPELKVWIGKCFFRFSSSAPHFPPSSVPFKVPATTECFYTYGQNGRGECPAASGTAWGSQSRTPASPTPFFHYSAEEGGFSGILHLIVSLVCRGSSIQLKPLDNNFMTVVSQANFFNLNLYKRVLNEISIKHIQLLRANFPCWPKKLEKRSNNSPSVLPEKFFRPYLCF